MYAGFRGELERFAPHRASLSAFQSGGTVTPCVLDVTDEASAERVIREIFAKKKRVDILINNAAVNETSPFMAAAPAVWDDIVDTNLTGAKRMCAAAAKPMMVRKSGCIINISSALGTVLGRGSAAYAASKAALNRFTEVAAQEMGRFNIRVNGVSPGLLVSGMGVGMIDKAEEIALARTPLGRRGELDEAVEAVLFLASDRASYITGHILAVDGGLSHG